MDQLELERYILSPPVKLNCLSEMMLGELTAVLEGEVAAAIPPQTGLKSTVRDWSGPPLRSGSRDEGRL